MSESTESPGSLQKAPDPAILGFVRCPVTHSGLRIADRALIDSINERISAGEVANRVGESVKTPLDSGLINETGTVLLPVRDGIITLVSDRAIELPNGG